MVQLTNLLDMTIALYWNIKPQSGKKVLLCLGVIGVEDLSIHLSDLVYRKIVPVLYDLVVKAALLQG